MVKVLLIDPALATMRDRFAERLPSDVEVAVVADFGEEAFRGQAADATVLVNARRPVDAATLAMASAARFIQMIGAGFDPIDRTAVEAAGITVAYNPGVNASGAAEHTIMLMLALLKRLPRTERATRAGRFAPGEIIASGIDDLADATVGLVGMGHIGQAIALRLAAFGSKIGYHARRPIAAVDGIASGPLPLSELLATSNVVSLHIPLTPETHHLIGEREIASMPRGSYLVNAGRGGLVDEAALRAAIMSGHLAGAGVDVLEHETDGVNPFADLAEVIVTPHLGGGSRNSMSGVVERCTANIRRFLAGEPVLDVIHERDD
jgi:phosphoglycerate dehydrogenase-like enzyme